MGTHVANRDATITPLATTLKAAKKAAADAAAAPNKKPTGPLKSNDNLNNGPPAWKCTKDGTYTNCPHTGKRFKWYHHHDRKNQEVLGMFMSEDHDHDTWALAKKEGSIAYLAKKCEAEADPTSASASEKKKG